MRIIFLGSRSGRSYIDDYLSRMSLEDRATILAVFEDVQQHGFSAVGCNFRQIEGKLWEIKIAMHRLFYVLLDKNEMVVLHAYKKQGQKLPLREKEVALRRMKEMI